MVTGNGHFDCDVGAIARDQLSASRRLEFDDAQYRLAATRQVRRIGRRVGRAFGRPD